MVAKIELSQIERSICDTQLIFAKHGHTNDTEYLSFLHSTKSDLLATINLEKQQISYLTKETTDEEKKASKDFLDYALKKCFPIITTVIIDLLKSYNEKLNEEESLQNKTTFLKSKNTRFVTAEAATVLASETIIKPNQMQLHH